MDQSWRMVAVLCVSLMGCGRSRGQGDDVPEDDGRGAYPSGPYGMQAGDTLQNFSFIVPWSSAGEGQHAERGRLSFEEIREDAIGDYLLVYGGADYCVQCRWATAEVQQLWYTHRDQGLEVFGLLVANVDDEPPTVAETKNFFGDQPFSYAGAPPPAPGEMLDGSTSYGLPLFMLVDLETMQILERFDGYNRVTGITYIVDRNLPDAL